MARALVVADDLTGANACAAGFARSGMRTVTVARSEGWGAVAEFHPRFDVVVATTDSRHAAPQEAADLVRTAVRAGWPVDLLCCRIDTTLRGQVGVCAEAMIQEVRELSGQRVVGLCQPAYPQAGRLTVDGQQLLHGRRLEDTELARDVRHPMTTSDVGDILSEGTSLRVRHLPAQKVTAPQAELVAAILELLAQEVDVIVADGLTEEHIQLVAAAAVAAAPQVRWVAVDPGPGSLALAQAQGLTRTSGGAPLLGLSGSATALTQQQLHRLIAARPTAVVKPTYRDGALVPDVEATTRELVEVVARAAPGELVLLATVLEPGDVVELSSAESETLPMALGQIARRVLQETMVEGLYTTGGDVTTAVLAALDGQGIEIEDEVVPLAVAGEIVSGPWAGLPIVTKGGLIGDSETALQCVDHLARAAYLRRRFVPSGASREPPHS